MANDPGYAAAQEGAAVFRIVGAGLLRIGGPDAQAFLQRQTSNDLRKLRPDQAVLSVLTSPTARVIDALYLLADVSTAEVPAILAITLPGQGDATYNFLKRRIFFNDKVELENLSEATAQLDLFGPQAQAVLASIGLTAPEAPNQVAEAGTAGEKVRVLRLDPCIGTGFRLVAEAPASEALLQRLQQAGAQPVSAEVYHLLRVENGLPGAGAELTEEYTPLETGLRTVVSENKGCYTGQEILARQVTYDKITQTLCGLRLEAPGRPGQKVWSAGRAVGTVTSAALSPRFGPLALAVIKRPANQAGTPVLVGESPDEAAPAVVTPLPFS